MGEDIIATTQWAIGIITVFVGGASIVILVLALVNFRAAAEPRRELDKLKKEIKMGRELEELRKFKSELDNATLLDLGRLGGQDGETS